MRGWFALGLALLTPAPAAAMEAGRFHLVRAELDAGRADGEHIAAWDADAWVGGDNDKLWLKSEGEFEDGDLAAAEVQALWSHALAPFWDFQAGVRTDFEPSAETYLVVGLQGLTPYRFETEATGFVDEEGHLSARLHQSLDLHVTQRFIAEPYLEIEAYAHDEPARDIATGLANAELGLQLRYEISRKFAPYIDLAWERALGDTATLLQSSGESDERSSLRAGVQFWF